MDELVLRRRLEQYQPEPLVKLKSARSKSEIEKRRIDEDDAVDLARTDFFNVLNDGNIKKAAENAIRRYGVGTCGPRVFFGTTELHLDLEASIAKWLGTEECVVYSDGYVAISSVVAAFCKRDDVVFVDESTHVAILQSLMKLRSTIVYYKHNNPESFDAQAQTASSKARKFLIAEGVSWSTGKILPLPQFLEVAERHKIRVFLDESYSVGVLGDGGRGVREHFEVEPWRIDLIFGRLETTLSGVGGFCAGSLLNCECQFLCSPGLLFSASLPAYLARACAETIETLGDKPKKLRMLSRKFHDFLVASGYAVRSDPLSAFKVFAVGDGKEDENRYVHEYCQRKGVYFIMRPESMIINLNVGLLDDEGRFERVKDVLGKALTRALRMKETFAV
ncbi:serine palmitoyltransferase 1-like [Cylas formicarius]|uniref:serine palmitoyltransferase 1-like n=1 Tax=Cylas formicarius TaxID=197179 RepID=UPI002958BE48|nr:serine palmitoyltransferase 1-like [Cylas formicarius]